MGSALGLGLGLQFGFSAGGGGGGAPATYAPSFFDDFSIISGDPAAGTTSITGGATPRARNGIAYQTINGASPLQITGAAPGVLTPNTTNAYDYTYIAPPLSDRKWVRRQTKAGATPTKAVFFEAAGSGAANAAAIDHITVSGANYWSITTYTNNGAYGNTGVYGVNYRNSVAWSVLGSAAGATIGSVRFVAGDYLAYEDAKDGAGVWTRQNYINGEIVGPAYTISGLFTGVGTLNGTYGWHGNLPGSLFEEWEVADPDSQATIWVRYMGRTVHPEANGDMKMRAIIRCALGRPTFYASLFNVASGTPVPVAGYQDLTCTTPYGWGLNGDNQYVRVRVPTVPQASIPTQFQWWFYRSDTTDGSQRGCWTPVLRMGDVDVSEGQSLMARAWSWALQDSTGLTPATPTNAWYVDGSNASSGFAAIVNGDVATNNTYDSRVLPILSATTGTEARSPLAQLANDVQAVTGRAYAFIRGGVGGTYAEARSPTGRFSSGGAFAGALTGFYDNLRAGIYRAGGNFGVLMIKDGEWNAVNPDGISPDPITTYAAATRAKIDALKTEFKDGASFPTVLSPIGAVYKLISGATDARVQAMRKVQWQMLQDYPDMSLGFYSMDIAHSTGADGYHSAGWYSEFFRRWAIARNYAAGLISSSATTFGPSVDTTTPIAYDSGAKTVTITFNLNNASALTMLREGNVNNANDHNGGVRFWDSSANVGSSGHEFTPTSTVTIGAPSGGKCTATWTFTTITAAPFVTFAWGVNPFNPSDNGTTSDPINSNWNTRSVILSGVYGSFNIAVQPYFVSGSNPDGIQAV